MTRTSTDNTRHVAASAAGSSTSSSGKKSEEGFRETVEAIVVAFILAMLVRGFEAEAFVIPTGSMAPTLMGRHKEVACPQCGYVYAVNASEEAEADDRSPSGPRRVISGVCVNCRYTANLSHEPSFKGDRILVMKFPYDLPFLPGSADPKRWDVVVFRFPGEPEISYIKRLVGLPGETLRIWNGDILIKSPGDKEFHREHRPLEHQRAMRMMVYDDAHRPRALKDRPEWRRWVGSLPDSWTETSDKPGRFEAATPKDGWSELRYQHLIPDPLQWSQIEAETPLSHAPRPTLITDFYSYNTNGTSFGSGRYDDTLRKARWVGDLTLSTHVEAVTGAGTLRFELIEGGVSNRCEIDVVSGAARMFHADKEIGSFPTAFQGKGGHDVEFANVDNRLILWVDGAPVSGEGLVYEDEPGKHPLPTVADLTPARIAVKGGRFLVSDLVLHRDIYYTLPDNADYDPYWEKPLPRSPAEVFEVFADPARVAALGPLAWNDFPIGEDRFLMLGDNSPCSSDSRAWDQKDRYVPEDTVHGIPARGWEKADRQRWEVPRKLLTGKAFCIYWPHGKPFGPEISLGPDFRIPFRPYVERMKWIQ